jgi:PadR family transcriptional regulator, regulatory protein AphA
MKGDPIRLTSTSYAVMSLLELLGEATPYDLKQALEQSIENFWHVPHTTFYTEPARLAGAGLLSEHQEPGGRRRKLYALTGSGREALRAWAQETDSAAPELRDEDLLKVFAGADPRVIFTRRRDWHQAKLAELESLLSAIQSPHDSMAHEQGWSDRQYRGVETTLLFGVTYHRQLVELVERFLAGL